jgi:O-antigen/teichoic acid export membrane protein
MSTTETAPNDPPATIKRGFLDHYGSTLLGQGFTLGLGVLTGILSARLLGPAGRGEYAAIIIWPMGIAMLCSFGINQAIAFNVGRRTFTISEIATATTAVGLVQSALSILIGLLVVPLALQKYSPIVQHLGIVFVLLTPALLMGGYPANLFQGLPDLLRFNLIRTISPFTYCAALIGLYYAQHGSLQRVVLSQLSSYILALVIGALMVWRILKPRPKWNASAIPKLIHFGFRTQATNLANYFNQRVDQLVLSLLVPPEQLGFYAVAVTLSTAVTVFPQAAGIVTFSRGSGQHAKDAIATMGTSFRASLFWLLASCSILYVLSPILIHLLFGAAFKGSVLACRILLPGALMLGLNQVLYNGASALGRPGLPSIAEGISMAVTALGLLVLVPRYGYIGAAIVSSIAYTISFLVMLWLVHSLLKLNIRELLIPRLSQRATI